MLIIKIFFWIAVFVIIWGNIGYQISLLILNKILKPKSIKKDFTYMPTVTLMIVAHNEEKVIREKLENALNLDYPEDRFEILVTSDFSTDKTNDIVKEVISENKNRNIRLYEVKERKGKTNAQNEGARTVNSEIIVMTDANSILEKKSIKEIVSAFTDDNIAYVTGKLCYKNSNENEVSNSENTYWSLDTKIRDIESRLQTITAGNGALYACRKKDYIEFDPMKSHDIEMPFYYALQGKKAIANHDAIAFEKAGENIKDEFKRKIRMNKGILRAILPSIKILNIFKYKWYTYFYLGHRSFRYLLWFMHFLLFVTSFLLLKFNFIYLCAFLLQIIMYILALIKYIFKIDNKILNFIYYYFVTIIAQFIGVINCITGKEKPFWEKAESTR